MSPSTPNEKRTPQNKTRTANAIAAILNIIRSSAYNPANSGLSKTIRISRKSFEDWLKMEGLDDEVE